MNQATRVDEPSVRVEAIDVAVTGVSLRCATGNRPFTLLGAVGTGMSLGRPDPQRIFPAQGRKMVTAVTCPAIDGLPRAATRMRDLLIEVLTERLHEAGQIEPERTAIVLLVPPRNCPVRGAVADTEWKKLIRSLPGIHAAMAVHVVEHTGTTGEALVQATESLRTGEMDCVLVGAIDSFLDLQEISSLAAEGRLMNGASDGIIPGEAAVFLELRREEDLDAEPLGVLRRLAIVSEPENGRVEETVLQGLARACKTLAMDRAEPLIINLSGYPSRQLEWQQTETRVWPQRIDEEARQAMMSGESEAPQPPEMPGMEILDPALSLGATGITEGLLGVTLTLARFEFDWPPCRRAWVLELPDAPQRSVIQVESPPPKQTHN